MKKINGLKRKKFDSDAEWIQAAIDANPEKEVLIPAGLYKIDQTIKIQNGASLKMDKAAILVAVKEMDYVLSYYGREDFRFDAASKEVGHDVLDFNRYIEGGTIDGNGLASCMSFDSYRHFTIKGVTFLNGKKFGLRIGEHKHGYELMAYNLYFRCTISGLKGNTALRSDDGDSHYTDIVVVDYTVGIDLRGNDGANRLTRCHIWGGPLPAIEENGDREMLIDSVAFRLYSGENVLRDCYADTSKIGFDVYNWARLLGCAYYNNTTFKLDYTTVIRHNTPDPIIVDQCYFRKNTDHSVLFDGTKEGLVWGNNVMNGFVSPVEDK